MSASKRLWRILAVCLVAWGILCFSMNTKTPIMIDSYGSNEPTITRGDLVVIQNSPSGIYQIGDVIVFKMPKDESILVTHRIIEVNKIHGESPGTFQYLTKGDGNALDDTVLYAGPSRLEAEYILGKVVLHVRHLGKIGLVLEEDWARCLLVIIALVAVVRSYTRGVKRETKSDIDLYQTF